MSAVFQAVQQPCLVLKVTVLKGKDISVGWSDLVDTPDPYVKITLPASPDGIRKTKVISNNPNPTWNETFDFYMNPHVENVMNVTLADKDSILDDIIEKLTIKLNDFELNKEHQLALTFNGKCKVDMKLFVTECKETTKGVRYSVDLCDEEKVFLEKRKQIVFNAMRSVLGEDKGPKTLDEVPTIAIIGSGGGFRAMTGLSGATCALYDLRVLDCSTYFAGLSGSSWYLSTLYSHADWPITHPMKVNNEIRDRVKNNMVQMLFIPSWLRKRFRDIEEKKERGEPVSFTDLFGFLVGDLLLPHREKTVLSDQKKTIHDATVPLPMYSCVHVMKSVNARIFSEWMDITPYEIGMQKYGTFIEPDCLNDKYFCGIRVKNNPEPPLQFIQGICGSAYTILLNRLVHNPHDPEKVVKEMIRKERDDGQKGMKELQNSTHLDHVEDEDSDDESDDKSHNQVTDGNHVTKDTEEEADDDSTWDKVVNYVVNKMSFLKTREGRAAKIYNFLRGLGLLFKAKELDEEEVESKRLTTASNCKCIFVCDAGLVFNSPYPIVLRQQRKVDLILSFDYSARKRDVCQPFGELIKAELWAKQNNLPFPPINYEEQYKEHGLREYYVFKDQNDPTCPIVIHFPLVNNKFKDFKAPGVPREGPEEKAEGEMLIFDDPEAPYSTFNFHYPNKPYDRLFNLCNFNTKICDKVIYDVMAECVERKRKGK